ncbi:hypothetical protein L9F63_009817, partial [Diploptera punctata]
MLTGSFANMKKNKRLLYIYSIFIPLNFAFKAICLNLLQERRGNENKHKSLKYLISSYNLINISLLIIIISSAVSFLFVNFYAYQTTQLHRIEHIHILQFSFTITTSVTSLIISCIKFHKHIQKMLIILLELDALLKIPEIFYKNIVKLIKTLTILFVILYVILTGTDMSSCRFSDQIAVCLIFDATIDYAVFAHLLTAVLYITFIFVVKGRFEMLNNYIMSDKIFNAYSKIMAYEKLGIIYINKANCNTGLLIKEDINEFHASLEQGNCNNHIFIKTFHELEYFKKQKMHYQILRIVHESLCNIVDSINTIFGFQIFLFILTSFTEITSNLYYTVCYAINQANMEFDKVIVLINILIWVIMYFTFLFITTGICNLTVINVNKTIIFLQRLLLIPEIHPGISAEIQLFLQQAINRKVRFTAFDFFTVNFKLMSSIVGGITTLLVMLVQ